MKMAIEFTVGAPVVRAGKTPADILAKAREVERRKGVHGRRVFAVRPLNAAEAAREDRAAGRREAAREEREAAREEREAARESERAWEEMSIAWLEPRED